MKTIMIMFDTLSKNFLPNYGNEWVHAPNFKRLEEKFITFDNFYGGSMPCMPARREMHTGNYNFLHRMWGPLEPFDFSAIEEMNKNGVYTHLITDHSHYIEDGGATYHNRYSSWEGFRGQEGDRWQPRLNDSFTKEANDKNILDKDGISRVQHFANRTKQQNEEDMSSVQVINTGLEFLENYKDKDDWFLQLECFDPHEPFFVPEKYKELYDFNNVDLSPFWPKYQKLDDNQMDDYKNDIEDATKMYAALISMCDHYLGKILDFLDENDMWEDTNVIVNTDHGFLLGEHNWFGKNIGPMYEEIIHIPFFMHLPKYKSQRVEQLSQTIDLPATLLELHGIENKSDMMGKSLLNVIQKEEINHKDILFGTFGSFVNIHDGVHTYMKASADKSNLPIANYTMFPTVMRGFFPKQILDHTQMVKGNKFSDGMPMMKISFPQNPYNSYQFGDLLFDIQKDPEENNNIKDETIRAEMKEKLVKKLNDANAPEEIFKRLGLENE